VENERPPKADDRRFLEDLYDEHAARMLRVANRILGNRADAEDLVHDVFVEAWRKAASYDAARGTLRAWLMVRVRSRAIDRLRSLQMARRKGLEQSAQLMDVTAQPPHPTGPDGTRARAAVGKLSQAERSVVELGYFEGLTCREIAERCEIPLGTVKSRLSSALGRLRREFVEPKEPRR